MIELRAAKSGRRRRGVSASPGAPMSKRIVMPAVVFLAAGFVVLMRWPRIETGMVLEADARSGPGLLEVEYRMREPFRGCLSHWLHERWQPPEGTGIHIGSLKMIRKE